MALEPFLWRWLAGSISFPIPSRRPPSVYPINERSWKAKAMQQRQRQRRLDRAKKPNWREKGGQEKSCSYPLSGCSSGCFPDSEWREIPPRVWQAAATSASPDAMRARRSGGRRRRNSISNLGYLLKHGALELQLG